jgi:large conductance mechanosensitive channel
MPIVGSFGNADFSNYFIGLNKAVVATDLEAARKQGPVLAWGNFITFVINFIIVAFVLFLIVKAMNRMKKKEAVAPVAPPPRNEVLLEQIRDLLSRR